MYDIAVTILSNLFRTLVIKRFMKVFFETENISAFKEYSVYAAFFVLTAAGHLLLHNPLLNIVFNVAGLYMITLIYRSTHRLKILTVFLIYIINMVCDVICVFLLKDYTLGEEYSNVSAFITVLLILLCELLIEQILGKSRRKEPDMAQWKILAIVPAISVVILCAVVMKQGDRRLFTAIESVGILLINLAMFYLFGELKKSYLLEKENIVFRQQTLAYAKQLDIQVESEKRIHALKHDMKHHFTELRILAQSGRCDAILAYVGQLMNFIKNPEEYVNSGNRDIDSIVNYLLGNIAEGGVKIETNVTIPDKLSVSSFDMSIILGNILENAGEALRKCEEKELKLNINYERGMLFIRCINSYVDSLKPAGDRLLSTKNNREPHGIGLENIKRTAQLYDGTVDIQYDDRHFQIIVLLYPPEELSE